MNETPTAAAGRPAGMAGRTEREAGAGPALQGRGGGCDD
jgi:hypothetical protein